MRIAKEITELAGRIPIVCLNEIPQHSGAISDKPAASIKESIGMSIEEAGFNHPGKTILESRHQVIQKLL